MTDTEEPRMTECEAAIALARIVGELRPWYEMMTAHDQMCAGPGCDCYARSDSLLNAWRAYLDAIRPPEV